MYKDYLKKHFVAAREEAFKSGVLDKIRQNDGVYTPQMLRALKDMADNDVFPDIHFSDIDCNVWMLFRLK